MDLRLDIEKEIKSLRGRKPRELSVEVVGELTEADLGALAAERGIKPTELKRLSARHHNLAMSIASGMSNSEAAYAHGYEPSRVSILMGDKAFVELVTHYRKIPEAAFADMHERLAGLGTDAVEELRRRVEDQPEEVSTGQLLSIVTTAADRTGFGPQTKNLSLHVHANLADRLTAARKRVQAAKQTVENAVEVAIPDKKFAAE